MNRTLRIDLRRYRGGPAGHRHDHHQIVVALEGRMTLDVDGTEGIVSRDVAALVPGGARHAFETCRDARFLVVDVAGSGRSAFAGVPDPWRIVSPGPFVPIAPDVRDYLDFLGGRVAGGALPDALAGPAGRLAVELLQSRTPESGLPGTAPPGLVRACGLMGAHLERTVTVAEIAAACGCSPARLHVHFRTHLGTTPRRWLLERRLDEAARLLARTAWPVSRIAARVGFADASAFGRAFRRSRGVTPLAYRHGRIAKPGQDPRES